MKQTMLILAAVAYLAAQVHAQSIFGEIRGMVTNPGGAVIVGESVTATNTATGEARKVVTDNYGNYSVLNIDAGPYEVLIERGVPVNTQGCGAARPRSSARGRGSNWRCAATGIKVTACPPTSEP